MTREIIETSNAPAAIGTYSQAIRCGETVYISGQIPLAPETGHMIDGHITAQIRQVFENLKAIALAAGGNLSHIVKLNVYLTDLSHFSSINQMMAEYFTEPYPARAAIGVMSLPRGASVEMDAILVLPQSKQ